MTNKEAIAVFKGFKFLPREQNAVDLAIKALEERPQGEWIKTDGNSFECSVCHRLFDFDDNYCGYCGANMQKGGAE